MYLNKSFIIGNLTRDPELKSLPSGVKVCSFSVATNRVWNDKDGKRQEAADFHNIVVFGRQAENVAQYMRKGSQVMVEGRIQTRSWDDAATGTKRYRTEIVASRVQFGSNNQKPSQGPSIPKEEKKDEKLDTIEYPEEEINAEDIPF
ncbi:MAG: single-stranded DNA-binding protein [Patescibacteria group bacterium]|nr:single-stranded DNA-binding protein [Patescibacteria group bacterium]